MCVMTARDRFYPSSRFFRPDSNPDTQYQTPRQSVPPVDTPRPRGLMNDDLAQSGEQRGEPAPKPPGHDFNRWILESGDFIQVGMVELLDQRAHGVGNPGVIVKNTRFGVHLPRNRDGNQKAVTMDSPAFMPFREVGDRLGSLKVEILAESDRHSLTFESRFRNVKRPVWDGSKLMGSVDRSWVIQVDKNGEYSPRKNTRSTKKNGFYFFRELSSQEIAGRFFCI